MPVDLVTLAPIGGRGDIGLPVDFVADVTNKAGVEDGVDRIAVVAGAIVKPFGAGALGDGEFIHNTRSF